MEATIHKVGIIMNGVTGRMGTNQHLLRSIAEIIKQGGVKVSASEFIMPDPVLVGRDAVKLEKLAQQSGVKKFTTNLESVMNDPAYQIYFDSQTTGRRAEGVRQAVKAGKHVYCEKPTAVSTKVAMELYELCKKAGIKNGVVQDKLWLPEL
jgi:predicted dehydrogenase